MNSKLAKEAVDTIKSLQTENEKLANERDLLSSATKLMFKLYKQGSISAESLEQIYNDLCKKTTSELEVLEKAAELTRDSNVFSFGQLGEKPDLSGYDPLTALLLEDY